MNRNTLAVAALIAGVLAAPLLGNHARAEGPSTSTALLALAGQAEAGNRDVRAAELYREAHEVDPYDPAPLSALGSLALRNGETDEAAAFFRAVLAIDPRHDDARHGLADALLDLDRAVEALALYDALLAQDAADHRAWNGKGLALDLAGRNDEAQLAYRAALALSPGNDGIRANLEVSRSLAAAPAESPASQAGVTLALNDGAAPLPVQPVSARRNP
ncbi:MAG: tetratricopeptide repeat protein [Thalassobaculum sp.]|uniref:tetratricopeptide repeat protein n=1 Tax=Thalassobaculum sp. TaxID=2022740 RepID=UPI0032F0584B